MMMSTTTSNFPGGAEVQSTMISNPVDSYPVIENSSELYLYSNNNPYNNNNNNNNYSSMTNDHYYYSGIQQEQEENEDYTSTSSSSTSSSNSNNNNHHNGINNDQIILDMSRTAPTTTNAPIMVDPNNLIESQTMYDDDRNIYPVDKSTMIYTPSFTREDSTLSLVEMLKLIFLGPILVPIKLLILILMAVMWYLFTRLIIFTDWLFCFSTTSHNRSIDEFAPDSMRRTMFSWIKQVTRFGLFVSGFYRIHHIYLSDLDLHRLRRGLPGNGNGVPMGLEWQHHHHHHHHQQQHQYHDQMRTSSYINNYYYDPASPAQELSSSSSTLSLGSTSSTSASHSCYITVCNHVSFCDVFMVLQELGPIAMLSKGSLKKMPIIGRLMEQMNCLFYNHDTRASLLDRVREREDQFNLDPTRAKLVIFPEGTTTNGKSLIKFHKGAFVNGSPVKPMMVHYPSKHFSPAWDSISILIWFPRLLCQLYNSCTIVHFPVYYPTDQEKVNPKLYAENVRQVMSRGMNMAIPEKNLKLSNVFFTRLNNVSSTTADTANRGVEIKVQQPQQQNIGVDQQVSIP